MMVTPEALQRRTQGGARALGIMSKVAKVCECGCETV